jgi:hypothetical protein
MRRSLDAFMYFSNEHRPRQRYRVGGRTLAQLFWGVAPATD